MAHFIQIYLKLRERREKKKKQDRGEGGERETSHLLGHSSNISSNEGWPWLKPDAKTPPVSPIWVARTQALWSFSAVFPGALAGSWTGGKASGISTSTPIWDACISSSGSSRRSMVPAPMACFCKGTWVLLGTPSVQNLCCGGVLTCDVFDMGCAANWDLFW